jgi:hypothetical protein
MSCNLHETIQSQPYANINEIIKSHTMPEIDLQNQFGIIINLNKLIK